MINNGIYWLKTSALILLLLIIIFYSALQGKNIIFGPKIEIQSPINGETYKSSFIEVKGRVSNINVLTLNDRPIFIDKQGLFNEKLLLFKGYNIIIVKAQDKFGKQEEEKIEVMCECEN